MKFPVLWSGLGCEILEILAHIELPFNPRVNKVFTSLHFFVPDIIGLCEIEVGRRNNFVSENNEEIQNYLPAAHTAGQRGRLLVPEKSWFGQRKDSH